MAGTIEMRLADRAVEMAELDAALDGAVSGHGRAVALVGAAGIGKTSLLRHAASDAAARGMSVVEARGMELERDFPFGIVRQLFEPMLVAAEGERRARLLDGPAALAERAIDPRTSSSASDALSGALHGLYWLTANLAAEAPLLLVVDDVHWSDVPSIRYLQYLAARLEGLHVAVLMALRPAEPGGAGPAAEALTVSDDVSLLQPAPLGESGVAGVLADVFGRAPDVEFTGACMAASGGNPFLLRELARTLADAGAAPDGRSVTAVRSATSAKVSRSLLARLSRLSGGARRLAAATAVLGRHATPARAGQLAGLDQESLRATADAMVAAEILRAGIPLEFSHPLVRSSVYADLPPLERARLHAAAAGMLHGEGAAPEDVATHLLAAGPIGRPDNVAVLRRAAERALARGAPDAAARYLRRALDEPPPESELAAVLVALGAAERRAAELEAAAHHLRQALERSDDLSLRTRAALELSRVLAMTEGVPSAAAVVEPAIERVAGRDRELELRLEAELAVLGHMDLSTHRRVAHRVDRFRDLPGDTPAERLVLASVSRRAWQTGASAAEATSIVERALRGDTLLEDMGSEAGPMSAFITLCFADRLDDADRRLQAAADRARRDGSRIALGTVEAGRCLVDFRRGDITALDRRTRALIDEPPERLGAGYVLALYLFLEARVERGEHDEADRFLEERGLTGRLPEVWTVGFARARGRLRMAQGRYDEALAGFQELRRVQELWGLDLSPNSPWREAMALALHALGRTDEARGFARELARQARQWGTPRLLGTAALVRGLVEGGDIDRLGEAVELFDRSPNRLDRARARIELGATLRRRGRRREARDVLTQGVDLAASCGGQALVDRGMGELRGLGARPRRVHATGAASLTAGEARVAELAARGLSNKEIAQTLFITTKTVEKHLSSVYAKLQIGSRGEVAEALLG